jgi:hypothetical protein
VTHELLHMDARTREHAVVRRALASIVLASLAAAAPTARAQTCPTAEGPDILTGDLTGVANFTGQGGLEALSFGTSACNVGDQAVVVEASTNRHYVMGQNLYRLKDHGGWWAMEQVGMSWLRHGFCSLSTLLCCSSCQGSGCGNLGPGCADPLSASGNATQLQLGPRWQVDAFTADFTYPPDDPPFSGSTARRLEVAVLDLEPTSGSTTRYFGEAQYLAPDDAAAGNADNNASYREVSVSGSGDTWTFALSGATERGRPALLAWQDADPEVEVVPIQLPGEGRLLLAAKATDVGLGVWHYEYALYNMSSHDSVRSFSIPLPAGVAVSAVGFHDVTYRNGDGEGGVDFDGTDWPGVVAGGALTWQTDAYASDPNANALRWGTTYNFRCDAGAAPVVGDLTLIRYRSDSATVVPGVPVPGGPPSGFSFCDATDGSLGACPCANPGLPLSGCDIAQGTGGVGLWAVAQMTVPQNRATLRGDGYPTAASPPSLVIRSSALDPAAPVVFGDGLRCVGVPLVRLGAAIASAGVSVHTFGHGAGPGTYYYQLWFRNQPAMFCTSDAFNLSNGSTLVW